MRTPFDTVLRMRRREIDQRRLAIHAETMRLLDIDQRAALVKQLHEMIIGEGNMILPLVDRGRVSARSTTLGGVVLNTWDSELWNVADWHRIK